MHAGRLHAGQREIFIAVVVEVSPLHAGIGVERLDVVGRGVRADATPDNVKALDADHGVQWADFDNDGDEDLALAGVQPTGMHLVMRNMLASGPNTGWLRVSVVDANGQRSLTGAEVRLYAAGTRQLLGTRVIDSGSGYNAQNAMPVQFGLGDRRMVDVEVIVPRGGARRPALVRNVDA